MKVIACNIWSRSMYHVALASRLYAPKYEKLYHGHLRIMGDGGVEI